MRMVIDTSVIVDHIRAKNKQTTFLRRLGEEATGIIALVTFLELYSGKSAQIRQGRRELEQLVSGLEINRPTLTMTRQAGYLRWKYQLSVPDAWVASLALKLKVPLASLDVKAFKRVKGLKLYDLSKT